MNYEIAREKNMMFLIDSETGKRYGFDVNTGIFYGISGKPVKSTPKGYSAWLHKHSSQNNLLAMMTVIKNNGYNFTDNHSTTIHPADYCRYAQYFNLADKLDHIGYPAPSWIGGELADKELLDYIIKNFQKFAKAFNDNKALTMQNFMRTNHEVDWIKNAGLRPNDHLTEFMIKRIYENLKNEDIDRKTISLIVYYVTHGLWDFYNASYGNEYTDRFSYQSGEHYIFSKIKEFFKLCDECGITPQKEDFFRQYVNVRRIYEMNKNEIDANKLKRQYSKHNFDFSDEHFTVVIPQTREDFQKEAKSQHNCVYSMYLSKVLEEKTNIVFIRKHDSIDESYITCEISNDGIIVQFLKTCNQRLNYCDILEKRFQQEFQKWLNATWDKVEG